MRSLAVILAFIIQPTRPVLINSIWSYKVTKNCINTLKFKSGGVVYRYDCELDYTFHDTYSLHGDTILISEKDDSHSEDGGKPHYYKQKYLLRSNGLYALGYSELIKGQWKEKKVKAGGKPDYTRTK